MSLSFPFHCSVFGEIVSFGLNDKGQCGLGQVREREEPSVIPKVWQGTIVLLSAGYYHCVSVTGLF